MQDNIREKCELFIKNRDSIEKKYKSGYGMNHSVCSLIYTMKDQEIDLDKIEEVKKYVHKKTKVFSKFRGDICIPLSTIISVDDEYTDYFDKIAKAYKVVKKSKFISNEYFMMAAVFLAKEVDEEEYANVIGRAKNLFKKCKRNRKVVATADDFVFFIIAAIRGKSEEDVLTCLTTIFEAFRRTKLSSFNKRIAAYVLMLTENDYEKSAKKLVALYDLLRKKKLRFGEYADISMLMMLAMTDIDEEIIINEIVEVNKFLKESNGFSGILGISKEQRIMVSTALVALTLVSEKSMDEATKVMMTNIAFVNQLTLVCMSATVAATSSTTN